MASTAGHGAEPGGGRRLGEGARALIGLAAVLVVAAVIAIPVAILLGGDDPPEVKTEEVAAAGRDAGGESDPFAWKPQRRDDLEARAADGLAHVLYANSPGGVVASAERTARWRDEIEAASKSADVDPDLMEAMVFLESAGRPDVIAGDDVEAASGLTQILASTGIDLLGMEIDVRRSQALTNQAARAGARGDEAKYRRLLRERAEVDERFDPKEALAATGRYLTSARESFAEDDLAVTSYHMGIGNLEDVIQAYADSDAPARELVEGGDLSYAQLYFDSSPTRHPEAWDVLAEFADDSATYLWRVYAARDIMKLHREDPAALDRLADLHAAKATQEEVFHPEEETEVFDDAGEIEDARDSGELVPLPVDPELGFRVSEQMGELAPKLDRSRELYRALRPEALERLADLHAAKATQEEVFHPEEETEVFDDAGEIEDARGSGELVPLPVDAELGFRVSEQMGELAPKLDRPRELYRALRPEALATLIYLSTQVQEASGAEHPLRVTSTVRDREYQDLLVGSNPEATAEYSLHTTGWSFDILRKYESDAQGEAFQFALDRLKAMNVLDYAYEPAAIHVTVGPDAAPLVEE